MARVIKFANTIRNNWKKSVFGAAVGTYSVNYAIDSYKINRLMRAYCEDALSYGENRHLAHEQLDSVLVILNPVADQRSSESSFDTYCAPILHLGGLSIDVVKTESEGYARRYVEELDKLPNTIICAGGDGTVSEVVTGLFRRRNQHNETKPVLGILPTGRTNRFGERLFAFQNTSRVDRAKGLADASISIVRGNKSAKDVMRIDVLENGSPSATVRPVYALGTFEWSTFYDAFQQRDRFWYVGPLRVYATYLFNALSSKLQWHCDAKLTYSQPCAGCSNCYVQQSQAMDQSSKKRGWFSAFMPTFKLGSSQSNSSAPDYSKIHNANCAQQTSVECHTGGITLDTSNVRTLTDAEIIPNVPRIDLKLIAPKEGFGFVWSGWSRLNSGDIDLDAEYAIRTVDIEPKEVNDASIERYFYLDNESYEVKPIRVTLLPSLVNFFVT